MKTSVWFSWVIFAVAIAALCVAIVRCEPIKADWVSIDIGILATLATCLVGWQIYALINVNAIYKRLQSTEKELNKTSEAIFKELYKQSSTSSMLHVWNIAQTLESVNETQIRLLYGLAADSMLNQLRANETSLIGQCLATMEACIQGVAVRNIWDAVFNDTASMVLNETYNNIIPLSPSMTQEQKSRLLHIHDSRTSRQLHSSIQRITNPTEQ